MRSVNLLKVAAAAETLRYRCTLARQGRRAAFGASALLPLRSFLATSAAMTPTGWRLSSRCLRRLHRQFFGRSQGGKGSFHLLQLLLAEILNAEHYIARVLVGADKLVEFERIAAVSRFWVF